MSCEILNLHQGNLLKGIDKKTDRREDIEPIKSVFFLCSLPNRTLFIRKQNGWKLQSFLYIIVSKKYYLRFGQHC
jgi:hypothetical protein